MMKKIKKYISIFKYSFKANTIFIFDYIFSVASYAIHMCVFNALWDFILKDGSVFGYSRKELIWYIIIAEFFIYGFSKFYQKISEAVKDGSITNFLIRPMNFLVYFVAQESGNIIKIIINTFTGIILGALLVGEFPFTLEALLWFIPSAILSFVISTILQLIVGLIAFFIEETRSIWFIVGKAQLLLVFVPIEFYAKWIQKLLLFLPTTHTVYSPATILVKFQSQNCIALLAMQMITIIVLLLFTCILYKKGVKKINVNGG